MSASVLFDAPGPKARARHRLLGGLGALLGLGLLALIGWRMQQQGQFTAEKWKPFLTADLWREYLIPGLIGTLTAAAIAIVLAAFLGLMLALGRMSGIPGVSQFCALFIEIFRAVPVLLMMIFAWGIYVNAGLFGGSATLAAVVTGLTFYNASIMAEVLRSGVDQLPRGQREAGLSVGLSPSQTLRSVLMPQAITAMLPTLVSQLVVVLKDTALGYNITYLELLYQGNTAASAYTNLIPIVLVVALMYIAINSSITAFAGRLEARLAKRVAHPERSPAA